MAVANSERMPDPVINGKTWKTERPAGMLFYNGLGDENGGLVFGAVTGGGKSAHIKVSRLINTNRRKRWH